MAEIPKSCSLSPYGTIFNGTKNIWAYDATNTSHNVVATWTSGSYYAGPTYNLLYGTYTLSPGKYQLQASVLFNYINENVPIIGNFMSFVLQDSPVVPGDQTMRFSNLIVTGPMCVVPAENTADAGCYCSGTFEIPDPTITYGFGIQIAGEWNFGIDGNVVLNLVKVSN